MKRKRKPDYIDEREFNRMIEKRHASTSPQRDSRGDSAVDEVQETNLGRDYREEPADIEDIPIADMASGEDAEDLEERVRARVGSDATGKSSDRPEPIRDLGSKTSTH